MDCPGCDHALQTVSYEGVQIETCESCGGEFVSGEELAHIVRAREQAFTPQQIAQIDSCMPVFGIADADATTRFSCPCCRAPMNPINYAGDTGVVVDRCPSCSGMWLEHSELEKVQMLLEKWEDAAPAQLRSAAGKLNRARAEAAARTSKAFGGSRFSFVNAMVNRLLDAA